MVSCKRSFQIPSFRIVIPFMTARAFCGLFSSCLSQDDEGVGPDHGGQLVVREEPDEIWDLLPQKEKLKRYEELYKKYDEKLAEFDAEHGYDETKGTYLSLELNQVRVWGVPVRGVWLMLSTFDDETGATRACMPLELEVELGHGFLCISTSEESTRGVVDHSTWKPKTPISKPETLNLKPLNSKP